MLTHYYQTQKEELDSKDNLLNEKFQIKLPEEKWSLFGNRTEQLEKQLILNKKASLAHQMHNSYDTVMMF